MTGFVLWWYHYDMSSVIFSNWRIDLEKLHQRKHDITQLSQAEQWLILLLTVPMCRLLRTIDLLRCWYKIGLILSASLKSLLFFLTSPDWRSHFWNIPSETVPLPLGSQWWQRLRAHCQRHQVPFWGTEATWAWPEHWLTNASQSTELGCLGTMVPICPVLVKRRGWKQCCYTSINCPYAETKWLCVNIAVAYYTLSTLLLMVW